MSLRGVALLCSLLVAVSACSREPGSGGRISPTGPSSLGGSLIGNTPIAPLGVSGPMDVAFPPRNESFQFRTALESKYANDLRRGPSPTTVNAEGEVVWVQEYIRYRANGCDHATAVQRVMAQIDGNPPGQVCGTPPIGEVLFPPRNETADFRRQLEIKYQQMGRALTTSSVDPEGSTIWIQEYLRYRANGCDHATAQAKVFAQIDGAGVQAVCFIPCHYTIGPPYRDIGDAGVTTNNPGVYVDVFPQSGSCDWTASTNVPWITFTSPNGGNNRATIYYNVAPNQGPPREGRIDVVWPGGGAVHYVYQGGSAIGASITLVDPFRSSNPTDSCHIRSTATQCQLTANANISGTSTFQWQVQYNYGTSIVHSGTSTSNVFTFTQTCGGSGSTAEGADEGMTVVLTVIDPNGTTQTVTQGFGIKLFTCS